MIHLTLRNGLCRHKKNCLTDKKIKGVMTLAFSRRLHVGLHILINLCADIELLKINRACIVFFLFVLRLFYVSE